MKTIKQHAKEHRICENPVVQDDMDSQLEQQEVFKWMVSWAPNNLMKSRENKMRNDNNDINAHNNV